MRKLRLSQDNTLAKGHAVCEGQSQDMNSDLWDAEARIPTYSRRPNAAWTLQLPLELILVEECLILTP